MAEIIQMQGSCGTCAASAPVSFAGWLQQWLVRLLQHRRRIGNADELPERMRRDMGLAPRPPEPGRHYTDYLSSHGS